MILPKILETHEFWLRLAAAIYYYRSKIFFNILHHSAKLPSDPTKLYHKLFKNHSSNLQYLLKRQKLTQTQYDLILPEEKETVIERLDIQTFLHIVRNCTKLKPKGGWVEARNLKRGDRTKAALLLELEELIVENIEPVEPIMLQHFEDDWDNLMDIYKGLKMDKRDIDYLRYSPINSLNIPSKYINAIMKAQVEFVSRSQKINELKIQNLQLEDEDSENAVDITNLLNQNRKVDNLITEIIKYNDQIDRKPQELYTKLLECDKMLNELKTDIEFLHKVMKLDREPQYHATALHHDTEIEIDGCAKDGKMRMGTRKLKAAHAYKTNKDKSTSQDKDCQPPYTKLELLSQIHNEVHHHNNNTNGDLHHSVYHEKRVNIENLFDVCNHVILRGTRGIGKTYIADEIVSKWVHGCMFDNIKYLFVLNYEEVKHIMYESLEDILKFLYPHVFEEVQLAEILTMENRMLLILDGWSQMSELNYSESNGHNNGLLFHHECDITGWFLERQNVEQCLLTQKVLVTTIPETYELILEHFSNFEFAIVDILGFTNENIMKFTNEYITVDNNETLELMNYKYKKYTSLRNLLRTPAHLSTYCFIFKNTTNIDHFITITEIYLWKFIILLFNHHLKSKSDKENFKLKEIDDSFFQNSIVATSVIETAQLAYKSRINKRKKKKEEIKQDPILQDLLTALFLFVSNKTPSQIKEDGRLKECLPFVAGLQGIAVSRNIQYPSLTSSFIESLHIDHNPDFINQLFLTYLQPSRKRKEGYFDEHFILFLRSYNEFQGFLVENDEFIKTRLNIKLHNLLPCDVDNLIHFLNHEKYQLNINCINLHTQQTISTSQMQELSLHLLSTPIVKIDIKSFGKTSSVFRSVFESYQQTKEFVVKLRELHLMQKNVYDKSYDITLDWLMYMHSFHLILNVEDSVLYMDSLSQGIQTPRETRTPLFLCKLKLTLEKSNDKILEALINLIRKLLHLRELELEILKSNTKERYAPYSSHNRYQNLAKKAIDSTDATIIKSGLYQVLQENKPRNLHRLVIKDPYCNYEFIIHERNKQVAFVMDNDDETYVDIELMKF